MVSPKVYGLDNKQQYIAKNYPDVFTLLLRVVNKSWLNDKFRARLFSYEIRAVAQSKEEVNIPIAGGCFMFFRTEVVQRVGGFDPDYFLYFEDFQLSLDVAKGTKIIFVPSVVIQHGGGQVWKKGKWHSFQFIRSGVQFFNKNGWRFF